MPLQRLPSPEHHCGLVNGLQHNRWVVNVAEPGADKPEYVEIPDGMHTPREVIAKLVAEAHARRVAQAAVQQPQGKRKE